MNRVDLSKSCEPIPGKYAETISRTKAPRMCMFRAVSVVRPRWQFQKHDTV